ncbi:hypothetical protein NPIL_479921 [Nephila pilipes]|uniref:Uncharacterized protein n=1 Tax=Nephila pilipes TaxID=299642 RepID=A0A8X6P9U8_NEPPI|nr:hypothetical protein NPIL_479921 [Nephila pilipes]
MLGLGKFSACWGSENAWNRVWNPNSVNYGRIGPDFFPGSWDRFCAYPDRCHISLLWAYRVVDMSNVRKEWQNQRYHRFKIGPIGRLAPKAQSAIFTFCFPKSPNGALYDLVQEMQHPFYPSC